MSFRAWADAAHADSLRKAPVRPLKWWCESCGFASRHAPGKSNHEGKTDHALYRARRRTRPINAR